MIDIEKEYKRFVGFVMIIVLSLMITAFGCLLRYAADSLNTILFIVRVGFYGSMAWNILSLRHFYGAESLDTGLRLRSNREEFVASFIVAIVIIIEAICFELI